MAALADAKQAIWLGRKAVAAASSLIARLFYPYGSYDCQYSDYYAADDACPVKAAYYPAKQNPDTDNGYGPT
jgi:hypothetical protein